MMVEVRSELTFHLFNTDLSRLGFRLLDEGFLLATGEGLHALLFDDGVRTPLEGSGGFGRCWC
jgi:hypothetical protein